MPIDLATALGAELPPYDFSWTSSQVLLYHLALGAGADPTDPAELRYTIEDGLQVLPTFAVVAPTVTAFRPPSVEYPGISIDLARVLHGSQRIDVHRPLPADGSARAVTKVAAASTTRASPRSSSPRPRSPAWTARRSGRTRPASSPAARAASAASAARPARPAHRTASPTPCW